MVFGRFPVSTDADARSDAHAAFHAVNAVNAILANAYNSNDAPEAPRAAEAPRAPEAIESGSARRRQVFGECVVNNKDARGKWALDGVHYDNRKLSDEELRQVYSWAEDRWAGQGGVKNLLSHKGQVELDQAILCRFMRPSELVRMMQQNGKPAVSVHVHEAAIPVDLDALGKAAEGKNSAAKAGAFVGALGSRLNTLTRKHGLLYMWYHHNSRVVMVYSVSNDSNNAQERATTRKTTLAAANQPASKDKRIASLLNDPKFSVFVDGSREVRYNTR